MRIGFTTFGCDSGRSGIGKYAMALLAEFPRLGSEHTFVVATTEADSKIYRSDAPNVEVHTLPDALNGVRQSLQWHVFGLGKWCREQRIDVLFVPGGNRRLPWFCPCPVVGTVHDLSSFHVEAKYDRLRMFYIRKVLPRLIGRLSKVVTVSECSKNDIVRFTPATDGVIHVIPNGYDPSVFAPKADQNYGVVARYSQHHGMYWIYVSRLEHPGKNHVKLMEAYDVLYAENPEIPHLVLAGGDWDGAEHVHEHWRSSPAKANIHLVGFVPDADLPALVAEASACIYPSLYEGFGIPLIEAMASGVPVACSNTSSLPEVGGDAVLYFDPSSVDSMARAMRQLSGDSALCQDLIAKGLERAKSFTWQSCAAQTLNVIRDAEVSK